MSTTNVTRFNDYAVATEMNNIGVKLLGAKAFPLAMQTLKEAIEVMKMAINPAAGVHPCDVDQVRITKARRRLGEIERNGPTMKTFLYSRNDGFYTANWNGSPVESSPTLTDPIIIDTSGIEESHGFNPDLESAIIFYNLALAHQHMSVHVNNKEVFLQGAHDLFEMAYSITLSESSFLMNLTLEDIRDLNQTRVLLAIVLLNNLTRAKQALGKHEEANDSLQRLIRLGLAVNSPDGNVDYVGLSGAAPAA